MSQKGDYPSPKFDFNHLIKGCLIFVVTLLVAFLIVAMLQEFFDNEALLGILIFTFTISFLFKRR